MKLSATRLRQDIYRVLDGILESGIPVEIDRKGRLLRIAPVDSPKKLSKLERRPYLDGDPEEIVHLDWSSEWRP